MIQRCPKTEQDPHLTANREEEKRLSYLRLEQQNAKLWAWLEERDDAIHEARRHMLAGDTEAALGCLGEFGG